MMRRHLLVTLGSFVVAAALTSCSSISLKPKDVVDTAAGDPQFSTLVKLINDAGLTETLRGAGPFTVFAPTNEAFKKVPAKTLAEIGSNKELLAQVLTYHVVPGKVMAADVKAGPVKTVNGASFNVSVSGPLVGIDEALVTKTDVAASNGVIHVIDSVLLPPKK